MNQEGGPCSAEFKWAIAALPYALCRSNAQRQSPPPPASSGGGSASSMLYEVASLAYSPTPVVAVASFLNLKDVGGSSGP